MSRDQNYRNEQWLRQQYVDAEQTQSEIAAMCDASQATISKWLHRFDVETRSGDEYE